MLERRSILKGLVGLVAAPAIIKVAGIMPVKASLTWNAGPMTLDDYVERILKPRFLAEIERRALEWQQQIADSIFAQGSQWGEPGLGRLLAA